MEVQHTTRSLRYDFSAVEINDLSVSLANKVQEKHGIESEKKSVVARYTSKIKEYDESIGSLSNKVASGYEMRDVECTVKYHWPAQGRKSITRGDTGQTWDEKMGPDDYNLFTQLQEVEEKGEVIGADTEIVDEDSAF